MTINLPNHDRIPAVERKYLLTFLSHLLAEPKLIASTKCRYYSFALHLRLGLELVLIWNLVNTKHGSVIRNSFVIDIVYADCRQNQRYAPNLPNMVEFAACIQYGNNGFQVFSWVHIHIVNRIKKCFGDYLQLSNAVFIQGTIFIQGTLHQYILKSINHFQLAQRKRRQRPFHSSLCMCVENSSKTEFLIKLHPLQMFTHFVACFAIIQLSKQIGSFSFAVACQIANTLIDNWLVHKM